MHRQIKILELESTNICNASCPQCLRTNEHTVMPSQYHDVLDFDRILDNIPADFWSGLTDINLNGNTGDNIAHPKIVQIICTLLNLSPRANVKISTNGSLRSVRWWQKLGQLLSNRPSTVVFGIDGLSDTHSLYRVNTSWEKTIDNARAFIGAGGQAVWQMIAFQHNQHQIEQCRDLAKKLGFAHFVVVNQNRFPKDQTRQPVYFRQKQTHVIQAPNLEITSEICQSMENLDTTKTVQCRSMKTNWMAIYADGTVWPCCFLMGWHRSPHQQPSYNIINYHFNKLLKIDFSQISLYNNTLDDILNSDLWQKRYPNSFKSHPNPVCLQQCSQ